MSRKVKEISAVNSGCRKGAKGAVSGSLHDYNQEGLTLVVSSSVVSFFIDKEAMMILERHVQIIKSGMAGSYKDWEKKWLAFEARLGNFPPKHYYSVISGPTANGTMIWEREWESFAAMEREYMRMFADPEGEAIQKLPDPVASETTEFYFKESLDQ